MKNNQSAVLLCRTMYCEACHKNKMPQKGQLFLTIGRNRQKYEVHQVNQNGHFGYTPHIIEKTHAEKGLITFVATCAMNGCESMMKFNEDTGRYDVALLNTNVHVVAIKDWNSLVNNTRDPDYFLG